MNARLYDPVIGRFFSPDPYVQMPEFTQNFNRYSYCLNNPLKYVDPSGEFFTWYEVNGILKNIDDGVDNLVINVTRRQFNRLERKFNREGNGYKNYRYKLASKNGYHTYEHIGEVFKNENSYSLPVMKMTYVEPHTKFYNFVDNTRGEMGLTYGPVNVEDFLFVGTVVKSLINAGIRWLGSAVIRETAKGGKELYNFGKTATQHMIEPNRRVPLQLMDDVIKNTKGLPDPRGSEALMHYSPMWKNGTQYQLEILYNKPTNSIWHFMYYPIKP